jgi:hemerythrin superfamily protein
METSGTSPAILATMGTVKPRRPLDVLELLKQQHDLVDELIAKLEAGTLDSAGRLATFRQLADNLAAHASMEEQLFYPSVLAKQTKDQLLESTEEHLAIKRVLADMLQGDIASDRFKARLAVLKEEVRHHARQEEEQKLFPKLRELFSAEELDALGAECLALFEQLLILEPRTQVSRQTREAAKL